MTTKPDYLTRINALRDMDINEYENTIDPFIAELEEAGVLDQYEAVLLEIDESFDDEYDTIINELMDTLPKPSAENNQ